MLPARIGARDELDNWDEDPGLQRGTVTDPLEVGLLGNSVGDPLRVLNEFVLEIGC